MQYLPKSSQHAKIYLTTDGHGLTRMKTGSHLSVFIRGWIIFKTPFAIQPWTEVRAPFARAATTLNRRPATRRAEWQHYLDARKWFRSMLRSVPSGGSPDGTGESPVLPTLNTYPIRW